MSFLNSLLGRVKNTVNNDIVKPIQRDVVQPATTAARNTGGAIAATNRFLNTAGTGVERSLIGTAQAGSGLYDLASRGTGTNRFSKALHTKALAVDAHAKTLPFSAAYKGGQLTGDLATFAVPGGAIKAAAKVPTIAKATAKVADVASHIPSPVAKATTKLVQGNIGQRVVGKTIQTATNPTLTAANAAFTAMQAGKEASQGKQVTPLNTAANFAIGQVGFPLAGHAAGEVAAPVINKGIKELRSAHLIKPTSLSDAELAASQKVIKQQTGWGDQGITADDAGHFHNAQMKLGHEPGTPEAATAVHDALLQHQAYESAVAQRKQALQAMKQQMTVSGETGGAKAGDIIPNKLLKDAPTAAETPAMPTPTQSRAVAPTTKLVAQPAVQDGSLANGTLPAISNFPARLLEDNRTAPIHSTLLQNVTHDVKHNAPVLEVTAKNIAQNEDAALSLAKRGSSTEANATAMQLLEKYLAEGSHEKASDLLQSIAPRFTRQGQETQILAAYSKTATPAGAVRYATKEVEKAAGKSANGAKLEDKTAQVHTAVQQVAKDVAKQVSDETAAAHNNMTPAQEILAIQKRANQSRNGKLTMSEESRIKQLQSQKSPEEILANRIKAPSDKRTPTAPDPVKDMVNTLHKVAKQAIPDAEKKLPRDPMQLVGQAVKGADEYAGVYEQAKALVMEKYKDNPEALAELDQYFGDNARKVYADSQIKQGMTQGLKGQNLSKIVKEHYSKVDETGAELKQKLIERAGLSESEATQLSSDIQKRYDQLIADKKESVIKQIFGDKPKPEQIQLADRILQFHNLGAMGRDELRPLVAKKLGLETLSPEASQQISSMAAHIQTLADGSPERLQATADMMRFIAEQKPQSGIDNAIGIYKAGMLSGVKTQEGNAFSNTVFGGLKKVADIPASAFDRSLALAGKTPLGKRIGLTGNRTIGLTTRGSISGTKTGLDKGASIMRGRPEFTAGDKYEQHAEINLKNPIMQKVFGVPSNFVFRGMQAADQPFRYAALKNSLYDQAYAAGRNEGLAGDALKARAEQLVQNPTEQMAATAAKEAKKAVLDYDTYASRAIQAAHTGIDRMVENGGSPLGGKIANGALNVLAPFVRVPSAFISRTVDFTPLGIGKEIGHQLFTKTFDQRALSQAVGEGLTGTGIIALGIHLSGQGQLSGDYPKNNQKEQQRWKTEGITPNSIKIGKSWKSLNYLGPIGLLFNVGKKVDDAKGSGSVEKVGQAIAGLGQGLLGQSFLQGLNGFSTAVQDPTKVGSYLNSEVSSIIPAWVNDIGSATDKLQRQANNVGEAVTGRLPGARHSLNPKQDVYGNSLPNQASGLNAFNGLKPSNDLTVNNPVTSEVNRLHNVDPNNSDLQVTPTPVGKSITLPAATKGAKGATINLNDKQRYDLQKQVGQATQDNWGKLIKTPEYQAMSDADKAKKLTSMRQDATEFTTRKYVVDNNLGTYDKPAGSGAVALAKGDISKYTSSSSGASSTADYYKSPDAEYKSIQDSYNKKAKAGWNSQAEKIKADKQLASAKVGSSFDKAIRDAHALSNADLYDLVHNDKNGNDIVKKVLAYDDALTNAGVQSKNKFRNKYGNVTIGSASVAKSSGGKGGSKATGSKEATQFAAALAKKNSAAKSSQDALLSLVKNAHVSAPRAAGSKATVANVTLKKQSVKQNKVKAIA